MRRSLSVARAAAAVLATAALAACTGTTAPTPIAPITQPPDPFRALLQPLDVGSSWWYTESTAPGLIAFVNTVNGEETIDDRPARWLQLDFAEAETVRLACVVQAGDVFVVAVERPGAGGWVREVLEPAQLFRPGPGARTWTPGVTDDGTSVGDWRQTDTGRRDVLGTPRATWTAERTFRTMSQELVEKEVRAERVGLVQQVTSAPNGANAVTHDLALVTPGPIPLQNVWAGVGPGTDGDAFLWQLDFAQTSRPFVTPLGQVSIADWTAEQGGVTFRVPLQGRTFAWTGRQSGAGLSGIATFDDQQFVLDFRPHPELQSRPAPSPAQNGGAAG